MSSLLNDIMRAERKLRDARDRIESLARHANQLRKTREAATAGAAIEIRCTSLSRDVASIYHCREDETRMLMVRLLTAAIADAEDCIMRTEAEIAGQFPGLVTP